MRPRDHNKTIALAHAFFGVYFLLPFLAAPWVLAKNIDAYPSPRRSDQIAIAVSVSAVLITFGTFFLSIAYGLWQRRHWARRLVLCAAVVEIFVFAPLAVYSWWFMHSEGGRQLYPESLDRPDLNS